MRRKVKTKIIIIIFMFIVVASTVKVTFSMFFSDSNLKVGNQEVASFIFNAQKTNHLELSLIDLKPGDTEEYTFQVSNNKSNLLSHVTIAYQVTIQTYHFMPLTLELYKVEDDEEKLILTCDETFSRDQNNALICNTTTQEMSYSKEVIDNYKLKVGFPEEFKSVEYADLVDYISIDIKSWQKTK